MKNEATKNAVNPLTMIPGGSKLKLSFSDGTNKFQNNVKNPKKYTEAVLAQEGGRLVSVYDLTTDRTVFSRD